MLYEFRGNWICNEKNCGFPFLCSNSSSQNKFTSERLFHHLCTTYYHIPRPPHFSSSQEQHCGLNILMSCRETQLVSGRIHQMSKMLLSDRLLHQSRAAPEDWDLHWLVSCQTVYLLSTIQFWSEIQRSLSFWQSQLQNCRDWSIFTVSQKICRWFHSKWELYPAEYVQWSDYFWPLVQTITVLLINLQSDLQVVSLKDKPDVIAILDIKDLDPVRASCPIQHTFRKDLVGLCLAME